MNITFIATPIREKSFPESTEDVNLYQVKYSPPIGMLEGTGGIGLESLLVESICELKLNDARSTRTINEPVNVTLKGNFPRKYSIEIRDLFDLYGKAKGVRVNFQEEL